MQRLLDQLGAVAADLRRRAEGTPLTLTGLGDVVTRVKAAIDAIDAVDRVQAGRVRRRLAPLQGASMALPYRAPGAQQLRDLAGEVEAVQRALATRGRASAGSAA